METIPEDLSTLLVGTYSHDTYERAGTHIKDSWYFISCKKYTHWSLWTCIVCTCAFLSTDGMCRIAYVKTWRLLGCQSSHLEIGSPVCYCILQGQQASRHPPVFSELPITAEQLQVVPPCQLCENPGNPNTSPHTCASSFLYWPTAPSAQGLHFKANQHRERFVSVFMAFTLFVVSHWSHIYWSLHSIPSTA